MSKINLNSIISEKKFLIIRRKELNYFLEENHFSQKEQNNVKDIKNFFSKADIIFYFLNSFYGNYTVKLFLPIFYDNKNFEDANFCKEINGIPCIRPVPEKLIMTNWNWKKIDNIFFKVKKDASWQGKYGFGLQEDNMPIVELDLTPFIDEPVKEGYIDFLMTQLDAYQKKAVKRPEFNYYVQEIKNEIELIQKEINKQLKIKIKELILNENDLYNNKFVLVKQGIFNPLVDVNKDTPRKNIFNLLINKLKNFLNFNRKSYTKQ